MLETDRCTEYLATVRAFADRTGQRANLEEKLTYLATYMDKDLAGKARTRLFKDFAPQSFEFVIERRTAAGDWEHIFNGGLIYHGPHDRGGDGGAPTFSVNLSPYDGWSVHT